MSYALKLTQEGRADVLTLPKAARNWLRKELRAVEADPYKCSSPLREPLAQYRSFHCGKYRVLYMVFDDLQTVSIVAVGKHDSKPAADVYKKLETLVKQGKLAEKLMISIRPLAHKPR